MNESVQDLGTGLFFVIFIIFIIIYFLPTIVALLRKHPSKLGIFFLNLFLGWSFIGWVLSLVWSGTNTKVS